MDFVFILYILFSLVSGLGGTYYLIQSERTLAGFLYFIGAALVLTFYGLRWFSGDSLKVTRYESKSWPPFVNMCPDFLSVYERPVAGSNRKEKVCVDLIGVSENGIQKLTDPANVANNNYVFRLFLEKKGKDRMNALCRECKEKKVTWEGVYDGIACTGTGSVPNADGTTDNKDSCE